MCDTIELGDVEVTKDHDGDGLIIRYDGGNRSVLKQELKEMCESDAPVTVR